MTNTPNPNLNMLKLWAKREIAAGRQISWTVAFATSNPTRAQIREWFDDCPQDVSKADTIEWLTRKAMEEIK